MKKAILSLLLICLNAFHLLSHIPEFVFQGDYSNITGAHIGIFEDKSGELNFQQVLAKDSFQTQALDVPNLMITKSVFWAKIHIKNKSKYERMLLEYGYPIVDVANLYILNDDHTDVIYLGESVPISERKFNQASFLYELNIPKGESVTVLLEVSNGQQIMLPLHIGSAEKTYANINRKNIYSSIYLGVIFVMFLYNLFIYTSTRDKSYLFYVIYIFSAGLTHLSHHGFTYLIFWPSSAFLAEITVALSPPFIGLTTILFVRQFLNTKLHSPKMHKFFYVLMAGYVAGVLMYIFGERQLSYQFSQGLAMFLGGAIIMTAIPMVKNGYRPALYFMIAWAIFITSVFIFIFKDLGFLPYNTLTIYCLEIGATIELILLSFALADRINIMKKEKEESQQKTMEVLKENDQIIREQNVILEYKVKERTTELEKSNNELSNTLSELKQTQSQLVDAEKMASLGQLTAGIAHEINNPINFVSSNINPLKRDIEDLFEILEKYAEINEQTDLKEKLAEIEELKEDVDFECVIDEIYELLKGMEDGANRTTEIVKGLRSFSRLDETDLKPANMNESLDSTLLLLKSTIGDKINVVKEYDDIKAINCYAGKLNQLFMNMLTNAIQATEGKKYQEGETPQIKVLTKNIDDKIMVSIQDNGIGMSEEVKRKVFEPFFTTKDVGKGTGLGMSIAYNIIEKHQGKIEIESELGKGTKFNIFLPKQLVDNEQNDKNKIDDLKQDRKDRLRATNKNTIKEP